jgi:hypothetical protein
MPRARQTIKLKIHKGSNVIPQVETKVSSSSKKGAKATTVIKAKIHKK